MKETRSKRQINTLEPIKDVFLQGNRAKKEFLEADDLKKRKILEKLLWNLTIENKKVASLKLKSPFNVLLKSPKTGDISELLAVWYEVGTAVTKRLFF